MRCNECKFWGKFTDSNGICTNITPWTFSSNCLTNLKPMEARIYGNCLYTNRDYGCVNFKEKPVEIDKSVYNIFILSNGKTTKVASFTDNKLAVGYINNKFATFSKISTDLKWVSDNTLDGFEYTYNNSKVKMYAEKPIK